MRRDRSKDKRVDRFKISIHAPARGATRKSQIPLAPMENFNPRTREGCDFAQSRTFPLSISFQSTHPRGVRPGGVFANSHNKSFQSTHPRGVRLEFRDEWLLFVHISIHAPARGATLYLLISQTSSYYFNPRTREGCDIDYLMIEVNYVRISIHAPARGATRQGGLNNG